MIREHLIAFRRSTGAKPHRIIFYRDGVIDGQFNQVMFHEVDAIRKALLSIPKSATQLSLTSTLTVMLEFREPVGLLTTMSCLMRTISLLMPVPFHLHGPHGVLRHLKYLIETKGSAVVCVAKGAGQILS
ncbi:uncharacterized protein LOC133817268 [Humulus lupulus]|uniref:uncharacterized protein LOC133817268 n=1 Tax=Humulus lupulus TaxID=3486 RepID=UPI002B4155D5|nr:uncharacterized protein LOC133817268 [Humulus lupulus]